MTPTFSPDERLIIWGDKFVRPVVPAWRYTSAKKSYYVAPGGRDEWSGSPFSPFRTIKKALETALPGDIIYVNAGTYEEQIVPPRSGEPGKPIVLTCANNALGLVNVSLPPDLVKIDPGAPLVYIGKQSATNWLTINGLNLVGPLGKSYAPASEHFTACGVIIRNGSSNIDLVNLHVTSFAHCGIKEMGDGGKAITATGCLCGGNGTTGQDHGIYFPGEEASAVGCVCWSNAGFGVHLYATPKYCRVLRCLIGKNGGGIVCGGEANTISHNVIVSNRNEGVFYFRGGCKSNVLTDNIVAWNGTDCAYDNGGGKLGDPSGNIDAFNDYFPGGVSPLLAAANRVVSPKSLDPLFLNPAARDFRLRAESPCRGAGTPAPTDIGAFG